MLLQHARSAARFDANGALVLLDDQDRTLWNGKMIAEGLALIDKAMRHRRTGAYQIQAAIAALHARAAKPEDTDWAQIELLYGSLEILQPSPVITLNRSVAVSKVRGPEAALEMIAPLAAKLSNYFHFFGVQGAYLMQLGRNDEARESFNRAIALANTSAEADHIRMHLDRLMLESKPRPKVANKAKNPPAGFRRRTRRLLQNNFHGGVGLRRCRSSLRQRHLFEPQDHFMPVSRTALWISRILSGLVVLFLVMDGGIKLVPIKEVTETMQQLGYSGSMAQARGLGVLTLLCALLYAIPRTSVFGAILLTGLLGGAMATHLRVDSPLFTHLLFGFYIGVMAWGGLYLRDPALRAMIPIRPKVFNRRKERCRSIPIFTTTAIAKRPSVSMREGNRRQDRRHHACGRLRPRRNRCRRRWPRRCCMARSRSMARSSWPRTRRRIISRRCRACRSVCRSRILQMAPRSSRHCPRAAPSRCRSAPRSGQRDLACVVDKFGAPWMINCAME